MGAALSLLTGVLFGALPAWRVSRADLFPSLREGAAGSLGRSRRHGALVVAEVALAFVLVASAALVGRSFVGLLQVEPGFESSGVVTFLPILPPSYFDDFDALHLAAGSLGMAYFLRTSGDPRALYGPIRDAVAALDRDVAVSRLETMDEVVWSSSD